MGSVNRNSGMQLRPYEKLVAWRQAYVLCLKIYRVTSAFPDMERFGLVQQMRRSGYGAPMNIAEGSSRSSPKDRSRFYEIAKGSVEELHCQSRLARDIGYISTEVFTEIDQEIQRVSYLLMKLRAALR